MKGYKLFGHFDGSFNCPPKFIVSAENGVSKDASEDYQEWESLDLALLSLLIATLSDDAIEHVIGCRIAKDAWLSPEERFAYVSKACVNHLKTELHTIQKAGDSVDKYLLRLKSIRDQLTAAGEFISNNDVIIATLAGLPKEYATIRTVILARDTTISMKEFRALLLGAERENEIVINSLSNSMSALYMNNASSSSSRNSQLNGGASSSNSSDVESSTGGRITQVPYGSLPPGFTSQSPGVVPYFPGQNFDYETGFLGSSVRTRIFF